MQYKTADGSTVDVAVASARTPRVPKEQPPGAVVPGLWYKTTPGPKTGDPKPSRADERRQRLTAMDPAKRQALRQKFKAEQAEAEFRLVAEARERRQQSDPYRAAVERNRARKARERQKSFELRTRLQAQRHALMLKASARR